MRLLLVDGHYYLYRSFFAIRGLSNSQGEPTNAIYGFAKALRKMLMELKPDLALVVWDAGLPERRTALQPQYKQHREEMPQELQVQQDPLKELISSFGVTNVSLPSTEADDLIASYAIAAAANGIESVIATNDKDIMQIVNDHITIYSVAKTDLINFGAHETQGKHSAYALLGVPEVIAKWGVNPSQLPDLLALTGDSADNIPGLAGIGKKTAAKWIQQYGSVEALCSASDLNPKIQEKIASSCDQLRQNRLMVQLDCDLPLPVPLENAEILPNYYDLVSNLQKLEFRSFAAELQEEALRLGITF